jgi:hypothetical protein
VASQGGQKTNVSGRRGCGRWRSIVKKCEKAMENAKSGKPAVLVMGCPKCSMLHSSVLALIDAATVDGAMLWM